MKHPLIKIYDTDILDDDICRQAIELPYYHGRQDLPAPNPVSYTHLTLPTSDLV